MKKTLYCYLIFVLSMLLAFSAVPYVSAETEFTDIDGHWAENVIKKWQNSGYISGYPDGSFKPDNPVTRAELSRILSSAFDLKENEQIAYDDITDNEWYYSYLEKSAKYIPMYALPTDYESNIPYSENLNRNVFLPDEKAIRGHVAEALVRIKSEKENINIENLHYGLLVSQLKKVFKDAEVISTVHGVPFNVERINKYMYLAYNMGIMVGDNGYFNQYGYMTRAELLTAIDNMSNMDNMITAIYLGVENYGEPETNKDNKNDFRYRFHTYLDNKEAVFKIDNGPDYDEGDKYDYPIQNLLKEGYSYRLKLDGDTIVAALELKENTEEYLPPVSGTPGEKTLLNFLKTAMEPVGTTLYIYGGGWDWQDEGSSRQARTIGVSPDWVRFFNEQNENFTYKEQDGDKEKANPKESYYPYGGYNEYYYAGLDCSGYVGWVLYNTFETENMKKGYVMGSTGTAKKLDTERGFGKWSQDITEMKPGELMSINGHIWISLGTCADGSTLIVHSTPSRSRQNQPGGGVQISAIGTSNECEAYKLADEYMSKYYPEWYSRYPIYLCDPQVYLTFTGENAGKFTWSTDVLEDSENVRNMTPKEVLETIFE